MQFDFESLGRRVPKQTLNLVAYQLDKAGINIKPEAFIGVVGIVCIVMPLATFLVMRVLLPEFALFSALFMVMAVLGISYGYVALKTDERRDAVDSVLPYFLGLASANVRAGMTLEQALWFSAKPEFGILSQEVEMMTKRTYGGEPFVESISRLKTRFNSRTLDRAINLLVEGMSSGGEVAELLERTSRDLTEMQLLRKEIAGTMLMYIIFIVFASCVGAPLLYALSNQMIVVSNFVWDQIQAQNPNGFTGTGMTLFSPKRPGIMPQEFLAFAILATVMTTAMSSFIIAAIQSGNAWNGLKTAPFMVAGGLIIFFIARLVLASIFTGVMVHGI